MTRPHLSLDIAKGLAVALVILGHTFQYMRADFDSLQPFRVIYFIPHAAIYLFVRRCRFDQAAPALAKRVAFFPRVEFLVRAVWRSVIRLVVPLLLAGLSLDGTSIDATQ